LHNIFEKKLYIFFVLVNSYHYSVYKNEDTVTKK